MWRDDMQIQVRTRRLPFILDPMLALCAAGPSLAMALSRVSEIWLTRSFWQAVDASELFRIRQSTSHAGSDLLAPTIPSAMALERWNALRASTDAASWPFRWIGDSVAESQVGDSADAALLDRWEIMSEQLFSRLPVAGGDSPAPLIPWWNPLLAAADTVALSAAMESALILSPQASAQLPWSLRALDAADIPAEAIDPPGVGTVFEAERRLLLEAFAGAGLASQMEYLPRLAAIRVITPALAWRGSLTTCANASFEQDAGDGLEAGHLWTGAKAYWYWI